MNITSFVTKTETDLVKFSKERQRILDPLLDFVTGYKIDTAANGLASGFVEWYIPKEVQITYNVDLMKQFFHTIEARAETTEDFIAGPRFQGQYIKGYFTLK